VSLPLNKAAGLVRDKLRPSPCRSTLRTAGAFGGAAVAGRCRPAVKGGAPELPAGRAAPES
jgi:hypothetical protein